MTVAPFTQSVVAAGSFYFGEEGEDDDARDPPITANDINSIQIDLSKMKNYSIE